jgi:hypothetical protein
MIFIDPVVDPAHPPKNISIKRNHLEKEGQRSKFAVENPDPVLIDIT